MEHLEPTLIKLVAEQVGSKQDTITLESNFKDIGADSLDVVEIALAIEDEFEIEIPDDLDEEIETVGDMLRILKKLTA